MNPVHARRYLQAMLVVFVLIWLSGCAGHLVGGRFRPQSYVVRSGDTLYAIAWRYDLDYHKLARWNGIDRPRDIRPGRLLWLEPGHGASKGSKASQTAQQSTRKSGSGSTSDRDSGGASGSSAKAQKPAGGPVDKPSKWHWPAEGNLVGTFGDGAVAGHGVDISGRQNEPVRATSGGEVVYAGSGLKAYGRLLILRHTNDFLSAYAHNSQLLVDEGDEVDAGETIARMGQTPQGKTLLHFEIRRRGNPVNPEKYLPDR